MNELLLLKKNIVKFLVSIIILFGSSNSGFAQRVTPLVSGISVDSVLETKSGATKIAVNPISGRLFYSTYGGDIYEVFAPTVGSATDSLRYTTTNHGISSLQGLCFNDSVIYLCGNNWSSTTGIGKIVKGKLSQNGTRVWVDIVTTSPYPTASANGDHGFSGINIDPTENFIYVSSGARTHLGEVRTNGGVWPGKREVPLTSCILRFPINSEGVTLSNDSTTLANTGYIFARGTRNGYDMAWDGQGNLFAIDNSGERDDAEELNWLRQGKHYGYPWRMGNNDNPLRVSPYNVNADPLVNHLSGGYTSGWFADDPTFPTAPAGVTFSDPVRNYGTVADFYKDPLTGKVKKASDEGTYITSFTPHRSPLGLVFDKDSIFAEPYRGSGLVLSFMPGGDSSGYSPLSPWGSPCPFVDSSRELVQMKLTYNAGIDNYTMVTSNIVKGFYLPVDAVLTNNVLYVIENGGDIWKISFPLYSGAREFENYRTVTVIPNPFIKSATLKFENPNGIKHSLNLFNIYGQIVRTIPNIVTDHVEIERLNLLQGIYIVELRTNNLIVSTGKLIIE